MQFLKNTERHVTLRMWMAPSMVQTETIIPHITERSSKPILLNNGLSSFIDSKAVVIAAPDLILI
jgi:hypothetical protein